MAEATPESVIEIEFQKVEKTREGLLTKRAEIDQQLQEVEQRFTNLRNALAALQGKFTPPTRGPSEQRKSRTSSSGRAPRGSREQLKTRISDLLKQHPEGLVANQITTALPDKGIPNLLSLMKKERIISQEARRGPYRIA
jgi:DNA gyrase/topoisomerase IV subunit A